MKMACLVIMVSIMISRFLALFVPAFCGVLILFSPTTNAQLPWRSPHGLLQLGGDAWTNPVVNGLRFQVRWTDIQPDSETVFDWSSIDKQVANAQTYNKELGISLIILAAPPDWLTAIPGVKTYDLPPKDGLTMPIVLPWDPIVQSKIVNFVTQLCLRYDGLADYIVMGGLGYNTESYMPDPADIGLDLTLSEAVTAWTGSSNTIIDAYGANLHSTPFIIAAGVPFTGTDAPTALMTVVSRAVTAYGQHFGVMQWGLSARSNTGYMPNALISQYSSTNPVGFQFLCPVAGNNGRTLGGTLEQTLDAGIALGAQWLEIYGEDADNPAYAAAFASASAALAPPPPSPTPSVTPTPSPTPSTSPTPTPTATPTPQPPVITIQPGSATVQVGKPTTIKVGASGIRPLTCQWKRNGVPINGATATWYTTPPATLADDGVAFTAIVSDINGTTASNSAILTVKPALVAPSITIQPADQTAKLGKLAKFTVTATGSGPLSYQWTKNGTNITGATRAAYTTPATTLADNNARFAATVSNTVGSVASRSATLTVQ